jgi:tetratricopeptide (TPR) repeat protein
MNKRLTMLEKLAAQDNADSFALYGLAMEYRKESRPADALAAFERLRARDASYLPMYLMAGQLLLDEARSAEARTWLEAGVVLATQKGDSKAKNELLTALEQCD